MRAAMRPAVPMAIRQHATKSRMVRAAAGMAGALTAAALRCSGVWALPHAPRTAPQKAECHHDARRLQFCACTPTTAVTARTHGPADGKVCLVTGASRGIGKAIALALGAEGAKVVVNYASSEDAAKAVAESIKASGGDAMTIKCNTGDREEIATMFKQVSDEWGTVDVLVNNAGARGLHRAVLIPPAVVRGG